MERTTVEGETHVGGERRWRQNASNDSIAHSRWVDLEMLARSANAILRPGESPPFSRIAAETKFGGSCRCEGRTPTDQLVNDSTAPNSLGAVIDFSAQGRHALAQETPQDAHSPRRSISHRFRRDSKRMIASSRALPPPQRGAVGPRRLPRGDRRAGSRAGWGVSHGCKKMMKVRLGEAEPGRHRRQGGIVEAIHLTAAVVAVET